MKRGKEPATSPTMSWRRMISLHQSAPKLVSIAGRILTFNVLQSLKLHDWPFRGAVWLELCVSSRVPLPIGRAQKEHAGSKRVF